MAVVYRDEVRKSRFSIVSESLWGFPASGNSTRMGPALDLYVTPSAIECVLSFLALDATRSVRGIGEGLKTLAMAAPRPIRCQPMATFPSHKDSLGDPLHLHVKILR